MLVTSVLLQTHQNQDSHVQGVAGMGLEWPEATEAGTNGRTDRAQSPPCPPLLPPPSSSSSSSSRSLLPPSLFFPFFLSCLLGAFHLFCFVFFVWKSLFVCVLFFLDRVKPHVPD